MQLVCCMLVWAPAVVQIYYLLHCYTLYFMSFCFYLWWPRALDFLSFLDDVVGFTGDFIVWHDCKHDSHADTLRLLVIMILSHCRSACRHKNGSFKLATINISLAESNIQTFYCLYGLLVSEVTTDIRSFFYAFCLRNQLIYDKFNHSRHTWVFVKCFYEACVASVWRLITRTGNIFRLISKLTGTNLHLKAQQFTSYQIFSLLSSL